MKYVLWLLVAANAVLCLTEGRSAGVATQARLIQSPPQEVFIWFSESLICAATPLQHTTIQWYRGDEPLHKDNKSFNITNTGDTILESNLKIHNTSEAPGLYRCEVSNKYGSVTSHAVQVRRPYFPYNVRPAEWGLTRKAARSFWEAKCAHIESRPKAVYKWYKTDFDDHEFRYLIPMQQSWRTLVTPGGALMMSHVQRSDQGHYFCYAENVITRQRLLVATVTLAIEGQTTGGNRIDREYSPTPVPVPIGRDAHMYALFSYGQNFTVTWSHNGIPLPKFQDMSEVIIKNTTKGDAGVYTVTATPNDNQGPSSSTSIVLKLKERPVIQNGPINMNITGATPDYIGMVCKATGNPHPSIQWIIQQRNGATWRWGYDFVEVNKSAHALICNASNDVGYQVARAQFTYVEGKDVDLPVISTYKYARPTTGSAGVTVRPTEETRRENNSAGYKYVSGAGGQSRCHWTLTACLWILLLCHGRST